MGYITEVVSHTAQGPKVTTEVIYLVAPKKPVFNLFVAIP